MTFAGGCLCGAVRFTLMGPPRQTGLCHCRSCRKHTGAPVAAFADCKRAAVAFTQGAPKRFASSPGVWRGFCADCGSTLSFEWDGRPDEIALHIGTFDDPDAFPPTGPDTFPEERVSWLRLAR